MRTQVQLQAKKSLETVLVTSKQALNSCHRNLIAITKVWANSKQIKAATLGLSQMSNVDLQKSNWQIIIRNNLKTILTTYDYKGYFIVDRNLINLSSSRALKR